MTFGDPRPTAHSRRAVRALQWTFLLPLAALAVVAALKREYVAAVGAGLGAAIIVRNLFLLPKDVRDKLEATGIEHTHVPPWFIAVMVALAIALVAAAAHFG